ncbi:MAG: DNA methylase N-4 [Bacteroidetes bacterium GWB2_41_8]|nr:MAG: DNA methylase N-4 [Bacteroidetes bacterium GWB2_41_8]
MTPNKLQKLELTWIGKGEEPKLEPRILIEQPEYSYGNPNTGNMLIHGDNLLALKALEQDYTGKIKCIYIDPPYNTGSAFEHYDDGVEHSTWLNLMKIRLDILWNLLHLKEGSIWISIDDREMPYLRVLLDEICGRDKFIASNIWQKRYSRENREAIGDVHEYIVVYARNPSVFKEIRNKVPLDDKSKNVYKNPNKDPRGPWRSIPMTAQGFRTNQMYAIKAPNGKLHIPPEGRCWSTIEENFAKLLAEGRIYFGKDDNSQPNIIRYLSEVDGHVPWTWWPHDDVGHTDEAKKEQQILFGKDNTFDTPKPERLIERVLNIASNPGDLILDSFLGSGTTVAVAQKMGRKYIGIELGEHAKTHCFPRLKKVVDGEQGGISKSVSWSGGGGFKFYTLAPSLLNQDKFGNWVISSEYNAQMLAAATAKQEGFRFNPHETLYWKQGISSENDYIFTTTQFITVETLDQIHDEMLPGESLMICCKAFQKECKSKYGAISIKKIPQMLLGRCEFGRDDYSLNIVNMPVEEQVEDIEYPASEAEISVSKPVKKDKRSVQEINQTNRQTSLFD